MGGGGEDVNYWLGGVGSGVGGSRDCVWVERVESQHVSAVFTVRYGLGVLCVLSCSLDFSLPLKRQSFVPDS